MATVSAENPASLDRKSLPRGLRWRGGVLWINKKIAGKRFQFSTGCKDVTAGLAAFDEFLSHHEVKGTAWFGQRNNTKRPELPKGLYWKGNVIWLSRMSADKHYNRSTGTSDPELAKQVLSEFNLKSFKGEKLGVWAKTKITFEQIAKRYLDQGKLHGLRIKSITRYQAVADHFIRFLAERGLESTDAKNISPALVEDYKVWRATTPLNRNGQAVTADKPADSAGASTKTLQFEVQTIGTFFKHAVRLRLIDENPVERTRSIKITSKTPIYLSESELKSFLQAATDFDQWSRMEYGSLIYQILFMYLKTGMRLQELRHLEWSDVDLNRNEIQIRQEKTIETIAHIPLTKETVAALLNLDCARYSALSLKERQGILGKRFLPAAEISASRYEDFGLANGVLIHKFTVLWHPKSTGRVIPISPSLRVMLLGLPRTRNLIFPDPNCGGLWRFEINNIVKACSKRAQITKSLHTHSLRHTFATHLRRRGVALETIKELLGHADIRDTLIYAQFSPEEAHAAIPKIDFF